MTNIFEVQVSLYENYTSSVASDTITLEDWLLSDDYKEEILHLRSLTDTEAKKALKKTLPAITPSALIEGRRCIENVVGHSGFICLDIDGKDNPHVKDWEAEKNKLRDIAEIAYAGLSASGNGIFLMVPIMYPEKHIEHLNAISFFLECNFNLIVDKSCKDIVRLRGISYDENPIINYNATKLKSYIPVDILPKTSITQNKSDVHSLKNIVDNIISQQIDITDNYAEWFKIGCVIANFQGEEGRAMFHDISSFSAKYSKRECDKQYDACKQKSYPYTVGTLKHLYKKYG